MATAAAVAEALPPADDPAEPLRLAGDRALTPDGEPFARVQGTGLYTIGQTSLDQWLAGRTVPPDGVSPSALRVVRAVSANEGRLEAVNSYDNSFLSVGLFQWTAGAADQPGELPLLLFRFRTASPAAFAECFGRFGLDVAPEPSGGYRMVLAGSALRSAADKEVLRDIAWAYRFWRAGHHDAYRGAQAALAAERIGRFVAKPVAGRRLSDWLSSEYAIALVLDEHVNRPGHVPATLETALRPQLADGAGRAHWGEAQESTALIAYIAARAQTSMTDPQRRAATIIRAVHDGHLSATWKSFTLA